MEDNNVLDLLEAAGRLEAVAAALEKAAERIAERQGVLAAQEHGCRIVATVDETEQISTMREQEYERRLADLEAQLAQLSKTVQLTAHAPVATQQSGRQTVAPGTATLLAKQGVAVEAGGASLEAAALDGALASLGIEQRIAVKAELLRAGLLG